MEAALPRAVTLSAMAEPGHLRISDQDRELAAAAIREHYAAGRLDSGEFEERLQAAYAARTQGELDALGADLPALPAPPPPPPSRRELVSAALANSSTARYAACCGGAFVACTLVWALDGAHGAFWPGWVLVAGLFAVVRRLRHGPGRRGRWHHGPGPRGPGARGGGRGYSYRYEYRYDYGELPADRGGEPRE